MAWSHSYTAQAYVDAQHVLETWDKSDLVAALREYDAQTLNMACLGALCEYAILPALEDLPKGELVLACMDAVRDTNTCDNGAWAMWIDPEGFFRVELSE